MLRRFAQTIFLAFVVFCISGLVCALDAQQTPSWPDYELLIRGADAAHVPRAPVLAIAWIESGDNLNPALRGHTCWNARVHHGDCEWGRFQIKPSTARQRCPGLDITTVHGNYVCFFVMFREDWAQYGPLEAIRRHHGGTPAENAVYLGKIFPVLAWVAMTDVITTSPACPLMGQL